MTLKTFPEMHLIGEREREREREKVLSKKQNWQESRDFWNRCGILSVNLTPFLVLFS